MMSSDRPPLIGVPACVVERDGFNYHQVGDKYVDSVIDGAGGFPLVIPALGPRLDIDALLAGLDGLLIEPEVRVLRLSLPLLADRPVLADVALL